MTIQTPPANKRTMLGGQFWLVAVAGALTVEGIPLAVALSIAGGYLVLAPAVRPRRSEASTFLLGAE